MVIGYVLAIVLIKYCISGHGGVQQFSRGLPSVLLVDFNKRGDHMNEKLRKLSSGDSDPVTTYYDKTIHSLGAHHMPLTRPVVNILYCHEQSRQAQCLADFMARQKRYIM